MDFLTKLNNNSILILPSTLKRKVLEYINNNNLLLDIKFMSFNDLKKGLLFDYNDEAIYYLMNKYTLSYDIAKEYIDNMYYLDKDDYDNKKLNDLLDKKTELNNGCLLIKDNLFKSLLKSKDTIYVYGYDYINKFDKYLLELSKEYINYEIIDKAYNDYKHKVYELDTLNNEVAFIAEEIYKLVEKGVSLNKIYIANYSDEYYFAFNTIFKEYNIPFSFKNETTLLNTSLGKYFIKNISNNINDLLDDIKKKFNVEHNTNNNQIYSKLIDLLNSLNWTDEYKSIKEIIKNKMKDTSIESLHYKNEIKTTDIINNIFGDDEYVFLIGFNLGVLPVTKKDEDYITDDIKPSFLESTVEFNISSKEALLKTIKNIKNLTITYKKVSTFDNFYPSYIIDDNYLVKEEVKINYSNYSNDFNEFLYANKIDKLIKFGEKDELLSVLDNNYSIPYDTYDNNFKGINNTKLMHELKSPSKYDPSKPKHSYSYSNISTYYKCPFKFYMDNFFRLNEYEQTLDTYIGSLFHEVLEKCISKDNDIDEVYDNYIKTNKKKELTIKDEYFIEKLREEVHYLVDIINKQYEVIGYDPANELHEEKIEVNTKDLDLNTVYDTVIKGFVDKYMVNGDDVVIVDYKTGNSDSIDPRLFEFGLNIQLPIYLYLLKNFNKKYTIVGMYLQHILPNLPRKEKNKTLEDIKNNNLKLDGLTLTDESKLKMFDSSYESSLIVKSLKTKQDGTFSKSNRLMDIERENELYNEIKSLIENCINEVAKGNFDIKPTWVMGKQKACDLCDYKDICYRRKEQYSIKYIKTEEGEKDE